MMDPLITAAIANLINALSGFVTNILPALLAGGGVHWAGLRVLKAAQAGNESAPPTPEKAA
jgi:hypothetical protein